MDLCKRSNLGLHDLVRAVNGDDLLSPPSPSLDFLYELASDVICRLFAHGRDGSSSHIEDCLDYLDVMAARMIPDERRRFLDRLLGAHLAAEQLYACHDDAKGPEFLWQDYSTRSQALKAEFCDYLERWVAKRRVWVQKQRAWVQKQRAKNPDFGDAYLTALTLETVETIQMVEQFIQEGGRSDWRMKLGQSMSWGQFFAYICVAQPIDTKDSLLAQGQTLFNALWRATAPLSQASEQLLKNVCETIAKGIVPEDAFVSFPERLARGVHWAALNPDPDSQPDPERQAVPLEVRLALSLYLADIASKSAANHSDTISQETN